MDHVPRKSVRAVCDSSCAMMTEGFGAERRRPLTGEAGGLGAVFPQEGQEEKGQFGLEFGVQVCGVQDWGRVGE